MGILFKSKRVEKLQSGGSLPIHRTYQVKLAQQGQDNPAALLQKYATPGVSASKTGTTGTTKKGGKSAFEMPEIDTENMLPIDVKAIGTKASYHLNRLNAGIQAHGDLYLKSNDGILDQRALQEVNMVDIPRAIQSNKAWTNSETSIQSKENGGEWMFEEGSGYVFDQEDNYIKRIPAGKVQDTFTDADGNTHKKYTPITRNQAINWRANQALEIKTSSGKVEPLVNNHEFALLAGNGVSIKKALDIVDKGLSSVGTTTIKRAVEGDLLIPGPNGTYVVNDKMETRDSSSNVNQLLEKFNDIKVDLAGEPMNALYAEAYQNANPEDIDKYGSIHKAAAKWIDEKLLGILHSKYNETVATKDRSDVSSPKGPNGETLGGDGPSGQLSNMSQALNQKHWGGEKVETDLVVTIPSINPGKAKEVSMERREATEFDGAIEDQSLPMSKQKELNKLVRRKDAFNIEGKINEFNYKIGDKNVNFWDVAQPSEETGYVTEAYRLNGNFVALENLPGYDKLLDDIGRKKTDMERDRSKGTLTENKTNIYNEEITKLTDDWLNSFDGLTKERVWAKKFVHPNFGFFDSNSGFGHMKIKTSSPWGMSVEEVGEQAKLNYLETPHEEEIKRYQNYRDAEQLQKGVKYEDADLKYLDMFEDATAGGRWFSFGFGTSESDPKLIKKSVVFFPLHSDADFQYYGDENVRMDKALTTADNMKNLGRNSVNVTNQSVKEMIGSRVQFNSGK